MSRLKCPNCEELLDEEELICDEVNTCSRCPYCEADTIDAKELESHEKEFKCKDCDNCFDADEITHNYMCPEPLSPCCGNVNWEDNDNEENNNKDLYYV